MWGDSTKTDEFVGDSVGDGIFFHKKKGSAIKLNP